jgi:hypothetical protein
MAIFFGRNRGDSWKSHPGRERGSVRQLRHYALLRYKPHQDFGNNVDLYTFFSPPAPYPQSFVVTAPEAASAMMLRSDRVQTEGVTHAIVNGHPLDEGGHAVASAGLSTYLRQAEQAPLLVTREALCLETHIAVVALTGSGLKAASSSEAGELFLQIGQFLRVQQSIDLLNAHGAQGQADNPGQPALIPEQDGRAAIDLGQRKGERPLIFARHAQPETRHSLPAMDGLEVRLHFAATI